MKLLFRVDSGFDMGTGHVVRCLTLANELRALKHQVAFVCKKHHGHCAALIVEQGFSLHLIDLSSNTDDPESQYSSWLAGSQIDDANITYSKMMYEWNDIADWLVVDHYAIDRKWHELFKSRDCRIMVIDDLANRLYFCDLLLDQTYGKTSEVYDGSVNHDCQLMIGSDFTLLRKEFVRDKKSILNKRYCDRDAGTKRLLIMMGGTDPKNITLTLLKLVLEASFFSEITVVLGLGSIYESEIKSVSDGHSHVNIVVGSNSVSELMLNHDVSIGSGGGISWERCAMGLPSLLITLADNQKHVLASLVDAGAGLMLSDKIDRQTLVSKLEILFSKSVYMAMVESCLHICDGLGVQRVALALSEIGVNNE